MRRQQPGYLKVYVPQDDEGDGYDNDDGDDDERFHGDILKCDN